MLSSHLRFRANFHKMWISPNLSIISKSLEFDPFVMWSRCTVPTSYFAQFLMCNHIYHVDLIVNMLYRLSCSIKQTKLGQGITLSVLGSKLFNPALYSSVNESSHSKRLKQFYDLYLRKTNNLAQSITKIFLKYKLGHIRHKSLPTHILHQLINLPFNHFSSHVFVSISYESRLVPQKLVWTIIGYKLHGLRYRKSGKENPDSGRECYPSSPSAVNR